MFWYNQDCLLLFIIAQRGKLLINNKEERVLINNGNGDNSDNGII